MIEERMINMRRSNIYNSLVMFVDLERLKQWHEKKKRNIIYISCQCRQQGCSLSQTFLFERKAKISKLKLFVNKLQTNLELHFSRTQKV
jgi:hypothetical protein